MSPRLPSDHTTRSASLVAFNVSNSGGEGSRRNRDDSGADPQGPWWFFALLAAMIVVMGGKAARFEQDMSMSSREGVGRGVDGAGVAAELSRKVAPTP
jgi:hypothetical protein